VKPREVEDRRQDERSLSECRTAETDATGRRPGVDGRGIGIGIGIDEGV